jgi:integrase
MARVYPYKKRFRVAYSLTLPGRTLRRSKYPRNKAEADALRRGVEELESATRQRMAPLEKIEEWIARGWIASDDAVAAFPAFAHAPARFKAIDLDTMVQAFADHSEKNSKGDVGQHAHVARMSVARQVVAWLRAEWPALDFAAADLRGWLDELAKRYADATVSHRLQTLRLLLDQGLQLGMIERNIARDVTLPVPKAREPRRILTQDEIRYVLKETKARGGGWLNGGLATVARLGLYAGLRNGEMTWCCWDWLDTSRRLLTIPSKAVAAHGEVWTPKDGESRQLDVKQELCDWFDEERERQEREGLLHGPYVIPSGGTWRPQYRGRPVCYMAISARWRDFATTIGLDKKITVYSFRHTYATELLRAGVDIMTVRDRLGHSDLKTTMGYLHALDTSRHPTDALPY